ncbi:MAG TPA: hypothetical protein VNI20_03685 [Fimbriimonadaceae bacterium]|nr:hypothetical protein [Fimbriimonadaceae bacterium]
MKKFLLLLVIFPATALAHHSRLFIRTTNYDLGHDGLWQFVGDVNVIKSGSSTETEVEPGLFLGLGKFVDWGFEIHSHFSAEDGCGLGYEATGLEVFHRLNYDPEVNHTIGLEYEDDPFNGEPGEFHFQWILGNLVPPTAWMANIDVSMVNASRQKVTYGYSLAWGRTAGERMGYALELSSDIVDHGSHELMPEVSFNFHDEALFKFGVGVGLTKDSPDYSLRLSFVSKMN